MDAMRLHLFDAQGFRYGSAQFSGVDEPRQSASVRLDSLGATPTRGLLRYDFDRASFFIEPSLSTRTSSERTDHKLLLQATPSRGSPEVRFLVRRQRVNAPGLGRLTTVGGMPGSLQYSADALGPEILIPFGTNRLDFRYRNERFTDDTSFLPGAVSDVWRVRYDGRIGPGAQAFASFQRASTRQQGFAGEALNERIQVGGMVTPFRDVTASVLVTLDDVRLPNTLNAFVRDNDSVLTRVRYRPDPRVMIEGGYEHSGIRRLNNTQTFLDTPQWDGGWISLRALPARNVNLFARHRLRRLSGDPPTVIPGLATTLPLFFGDDDRTEAGGSVTWPRGELLYFSYARTDRNNDPRQVGFTSTSYNAGLSLPLVGALMLNADWGRQDWSGRGAVLIADPLGLNLGRALISDGDSVNMGVTYTGSRDSIASQLYRYTSTGGESVRGHGAAVAYHRQLTGRYGVRLQFGWDDYSDRILPGFGNSDSFVRLDLLRRF